MAVKFLSKKHRKNDALLWVPDLTDVNDVIEAFVVEFLNMKNLSLESNFISYYAFSVSSTSIIIKHIPSIILIKTSFYIRIIPVLYKHSVI